MSIENINVNVTTTQLNVNNEYVSSNSNGFIKKISNYISDFEIMDFEENIENKVDLLEITGAKVSTEITSKLSGIENWFYDANKFVEEEIIPVLENVGKNVTNALERTTATIALGGLSLIEGLGQFGEAAIDLITLAGTAVASVGTGIYDGIQAIYGSITGNEWESATKEMWNMTKGFVAEKHVTKAFDDLYNDTGFGNYIKENAFGYETVRTIGSGVGYVAGVVAISLLTFGLGGAAVGAGSAAGGLAVTASQTATVAGLAGIGKGTQDSWADGASLGEGLATGTLTGLWEGIQFYLGAKIGGSNLINLEGTKGKFLNSLTRVVLDGLDSGTEGFIQPLIASIYKDGYTNDLGEYIEFNSSDNFFERYGEIFNDYGSWQNVLTQASIGTIGSALGEGLDLTKLLKNETIKKLHNEEFTSNSEKLLNIFAQFNRTKDKMFLNSDNYNITKSNLSSQLAYYFNDPKQFIISKMSNLYHSSLNKSQLSSEIIDFMNVINQTKVSDINYEYVEYFSKYLNDEDIIKFQEITKKNILNKYTDIEKKLVKVYTAIGGPSITAYLRKNNCQFNGTMMYGTSKGFVDDYLARSMYAVNEGNLVGKYSDVDTFIKEMDKIIDKSQPLKENITVYRSCDQIFMDGNKIMTLDIGTKFNDPAFMSTSIIPTNIATKSNIIMELEIPKGTKAAYLEPITGVTGYNQQEMLLGRNSEFEIMEYNFDEITGQLFIKAKLVN